jgi:hypothetical protein
MSISKSKATSRKQISERVLKKFSWEKCYSNFRSLCTRSTVLRDDILKKQVDLQARTDENQALRTGMQQETKIEYLIDVFETFFPTNTGKIPRGKPSPQIEFSASIFLYFSREFPRMSESESEPEVEHRTQADIDTENLQMNVYYETPADYEQYVKPGGEVWPVNRVSF